MLSRQAATGIAMILLGVVGALGGHFSDAERAQISQHIEVILGGFVSSFGAALWIFRLITKTPMVGLMFKQPPAGHTPKPRHSSRITQRMLLRKRDARRDR